MVAEVKNIEELFSQYIGPKKKVVSSKIEHLLAPGENYLSVVLKVDVVVQDEETGKEEKLSTVGKTIHSGDVHEIMKMIGKISYKYEKNWYTEILPTLQNFLTEKGFTRNFDIFPNLIGYRANLHGENNEVDDDSILLMENLIVNGFSNIDRHVSFDYESAKIILKDLATFHAVPLALKLKKRKQFQEKIMKNLVKPEFIPPEPKEGEKGRERRENNTFEVWLELLETRKHCKLYLPKLKEFFDFVKENPEVIWGKREKREPFATISHNDLWVNNTMQVFENGKMVKNKLLDFQVYSYDSPAHDLLFFIWSSVQFSVIKEHFYDLIQHYHSNFLEVLLELGCEGTPFSFDKFEEELKYAAKFEICHTMQMVLAIFAVKGEFAFDMTKPPDETKLTKEAIGDALVDRCAFIIQICGKKGWI